MNNTNKVILFAGFSLLSAIGGYFLYKQIKFGNWRKNSRKIVFVKKTEEVEIIISNFDSIWDYKYIPSASSGEKWFTKRKTSTIWLNMKTSLSLQNYTIAIGKLMDFLNK